MIRPLHLRRSWLFVGAANEFDIQASFESEADVCILDFEDFCLPKNRPLARKMLPKILEKWKGLGKVTATRINPLDTKDGLKDLEASISKNLDVILLPKVNYKEQVDFFLKKKRIIEIKKKIKKNTIQFIPNIETAIGIENIKDIFSFDQVIGSLIASEDMAASLGLIESKNNDMLNFIRKRFHLACKAFNKYSIDMPYTWNNKTELKRELQYIKSLGMTAKSSINASHCSIINKALTPAANEANKAKKIVKSFEKAIDTGKSQIYFDKQYLEIPAYHSALNTLNRFNELVRFNNLNKNNN